MDLRRWIHMTTRVFRLPFLITVGVSRLGWLGETMTVVASKRMIVSTVFFCVEQWQERTVFCTLCSSANSQPYDKHSKGGRWTYNTASACCTASFPKVHCVMEGLITFFHLASLFLKACTTTSYRWCKSGPFVSESGLDTLKCPLLCLKPW